MQKDNRTDVSPISEDVLLAKSKGSVPGTVSVTLDSNAKPVAQPARRIPVGLIDDLTRMVADGVIESITKPIKWNNKPIAYASRALTKSEQAYCLIERKMLEIVNGPLNKVPPRLQRMMLAAQGFNLHVVYKLGKELFIVDALSTAFVNEPVEKKFYNLNEVRLVENLSIADRIFDKINNETCKDTELIELKKYITAGWPDNKKTRIPIRSEDLKPKVYQHPEKFNRHQDTVKKYYDKQTTPLQPLRKVKGKGPQPRSHQVRDDRGNLFTRNRVMINPSPPTTPPANSTPAMLQPVQIHQQIKDFTLQKTTEEKAVKNLDHKITRSGRVRNPKRLFDD
ncbi:hypothetical protein ILUMI_11165 [Ignelater luminosus]|uniref:Reverse transcriptase/retrotransposon-derived protein RNase H-like domain-containing protein n=1 Tax=Ignelater luminosus TaxID=2038154 RepID=A0A8K0CYZ1_IGNLU|nr:hypothetical protein ILUMI_11165 [Ignelater luminosus]